MCMFFAAHTHVEIDASLFPSTLLLSDTSDLENQAGLQVVLILLILLENLDCIYIYIIYISHYYFAETRQKHASVRSPPPLRRGHRHGRGDTPRHRQDLPRRLGPRVPRVQQRLPPDVRGARAAHLHRPVPPGMRVQEGTHPPQGREMRQAESLSQERLDSGGLFDIPAYLLAERGFRGCACSA